jgi:hypothetical protein
VSVKRKSQEAKRISKIERLDMGFLADQVDAVATMMWALAERMEYYAGFNTELVSHSREMAGASTIARGWAKAIRKESKKVVK